MRSRCLKEAPLLSYSLFTHGRLHWNKATSTCFPVGRANPGRRSSGITTFLLPPSGVCGVHPSLTLCSVMPDWGLKSAITRLFMPQKSTNATNQGFALCPPSQLLNICHYTAASLLWKHCFRWLSLGAAFWLENTFGSRGPWWLGKDRKEFMGWLQAGSGLGLGNER